MTVNMRDGLSMASPEQAAQLPGANADLDSFADPFRKKVCSIFWTKLQKLLLVTWLARSRSS